MAVILLAGATGLIGSASLELLLADRRVTQVVAPTRRALPPHPKLLNPIVTIETLPHDAAWWSVDGALCAIGTTNAKTPSPADYRVIDHDYPLAIATLVRERGAKGFALVSSMGADTRSRFRYTRMKGELETAIERLAFPSLVIARPGFLGGSRSEHRPMERTIATILRLIAPILPASARINPATAVAALLVEALLAGHTGRRIISASEIAHASEKSG